MTVKELIIKLQAYPPDLLVLVNGYEWGLESPPSVSRKKVLHDGTDDSQNSYGGPFAISDSPDAIDAVVIHRRS